MTITSMSPALAVVLCFLVTGGVELQLAAGLPHAKNCTAENNVTHSIAQGPCCNDSLIGLSATHIYTEPKTQTNPPAHNPCNKTADGKAPLSDPARTCPPWFDRQNTTCKCGSRLNGRVRCDQNSSQAYLLNCNCMTFDSAKGSTVVGACLYNCFQRSSYSSEDTVYHKLPPSVSQINEDICGPLHRSGRLCGNCKDGYVQPSYSYRLDCVKCSYSRWNWVKYILVAFLPLTVFFAVLVGCRFNATSKQLNAFILHAQMISNPSEIQIIVAAVQTNPSLTLPLLGAHTIATLYGIWNLDFFRTVVPPICLNLSSLQLISLDYAIGFYPLVLIAVTYNLINLHERNFKPVVWLWSPFKRCLVQVRREWNIKSSIIEAFATFLILSYLRFLSVSFNILVPTQVFDIHGHSRLYLYYNASIEYFGEEHLPYAIVAVFVLLVFNILPLLLLLIYPLRCFQRCLNRCRLRSLALTTFMDAFQGHYKNGTNGTLDCRYFSATWFVLQFLWYIVFASTLSKYFLPIMAVICVSISVLMVAFKPYKSPPYNSISIILLLMLALICLGSLCVTIGAYTKNSTFVRFGITIGLIFSVVPLVYITGLVLYLLLHKRLPQKCLQKYWSRSTRGDESSEALLPDRLLNPTNYTESEEELYY